VSGEGYVSGTDIRRIENKEFKRYDTERARKIVIALDHSNVPFFARFTDKQISLTFDKHTPIRLTKLSQRQCRAAMRNCSVRSNARKIRRVI
jgi:hypothetical protein